MLHKAYVEELVDRYRYRVRIPVLHKIKNAPGCTPTNELPIATLAVTPGNIPHILKNSVVYIDFESDDDSQPVILGVLLSESEENSQESKSSSDIVNLEVDNVCSLPKETSIGDITPYQIGCLTKLDRPIDDYINYSLFYSNLKQELLDMIYPIGSILYRADEVDPSALFGGQWERLTDRFLCDFNDQMVGIQGGQAAVKLEANNLPPHTHNYNQAYSSTTYETSGTSGIYPFYANSLVRTEGTYTSEGTEITEPSSFSILPPYEVVRIYKRIA